MLCQEHRYHVAISISLLSYSETSSTILEQFRMSQSVHIPEWMKHLTLTTHLFKNRLSFSL